MRARIRVCLESVLDLAAIQPTLNAIAPHRNAADWDVPK
jgi:hypothetical protein